MSHKVHPKIYRIKEIADWNVRGFYKKFPLSLEEDSKIREFLKKRLKESGVQNIEIERSLGKINVIINTSRPGLIIGRSGSGVEELKKEMEGKIFFRKQKPSFAKESAGKKEIKIEIREIKNPWLSASLAGQWIAGQIEKRIPFRRVLKQSLEKIMVNKEAKGARIEISGRLDGSEIARREWFKKGQLPRQTLRADIDYAEERAYCTYGVVGIKVWIYKGEKFS
jgi:small subunit ribosomal protein S3